MATLKYWSLGQLIQLLLFENGVSSGQTTASGFCCWAFWISEIVVPSGKISLSEPLGKFVTNTCVAPTHACLSCENVLPFGQVVHCFDVKLNNEFGDSQLKQFPFAKKGLSDGQAVPGSLLNSLMLVPGGIIILFDPESKFGFVGEFGETGVKQLLFDAIKFSQFSHFLLSILK